MDSSLALDSGASQRLPIRLTRFIGREREIADLQQLLGTERLVTIVGPPGVGKTRLALQVGAGLQGHVADGVWFVELAALAEPALVPDAVAATLGVREQAGRPLLATLNAYFEQRQILLILDNCEHLVLACATLAESLLRSSPDLRVLATSREALRIEGETTWRVPPLSMPSLATTVSGTRAPATDLLQYEAVQLFAERARAARPAFALSDENADAVVRLCQRLDGIPLAIELAAARIGTLSVEQIVARLDDHFALLTGGSRTALPRQQTLRGAVNWSFNLLAEDERIVLRRLSVFAGGWPLEAIEAVCDGAVRDEQGVPSDIAALARLASLDSLPEVLLQLVDKSLVHVDEGNGPAPRYRLLEMIRQFGLEQLRAAGEEAEVRRRHLAWCADLAQDGDVGMYGPEALAWLDRLEAELDNVRVALNWSLSDLDRTSAQVGLGLGGALGQFWMQRHHLAEGRRWLQQALAADDARRHDGVDGGTGGLEPTIQTVRAGEAAPHPRVGALYVLANLEQQLGSMTEGAAHAEAAVELARALGDRVGEVLALAASSSHARAFGEYRRAAALGEESLAICRELDSPFARWRATITQGENASVLGDLKRARVLHEESLATAQSMGFLWGIGQASRVLGLTAFREGDLDRAMTLLEESLRSWRQLRSLSGPHWALRELGHVVLARGDPWRAMACFAEGLALNVEQGHPRNIPRCLEGLAAAVAKVGSEKKPWSISVARLIGLAESIDQGTNDPLSSLVRPVVERAAVAARSDLGEAAYAAALAEGRAMSLTRALDLARQLAHPAEGAVDEPTPAAAQTSLPSASSGAPLTPREREVAALVARGLTNRQIAEALVISERTVHGHVASILARLDFGSRAQIAAWAVHHGLMPDAP